MNDRLASARTTLQEAEKRERRLQCQLEFAQGFSSWIGFGTDLVDEAKRLSLERASLEAIEEVLAPIGTQAKAHKIICVGHGHLDMNWMWSWPETVSACRDTFASVLQIMLEDDEVTYSQSQTAVYAAMEKYHPALFEAIRERVQEGRWEVTAAQWVEGDKNLSGGDSLLRHYRYSQAYCREKFGVECPVQWEPDTFGHAETLPMIAARNGIGYYYSCRTGGGFDNPRIGEKRPPLFWWQAPSGDRILVNRELSWYNSYVNIGENIALVALEFWRSTGSKNWLNVYGFGNHGGGPTRKEIAYLKEMREWPIYPQVEFGTALSFFEAVATENLDLPTLSHELNFEFPGCYTSQSLIKQANRLGENYCLEADAFAAMSGLDLPAHREQAWKNVLFNQFHDILPGSGIRQTREHATALFQEAAALTGSLKGDAMRHLADQIDTQSLAPSGAGTGAGGEAGHGLGALLGGVSTVSGGGSGAFPFVVFNTLTWARKESVALTLWDSGLDPKKVVCRDAEGRSHKALLVDQGSEWGHDKLVFLVPVSVPAFGWTTLTLLETTGEATEEGGITVHSGTRIATETLDVDFERFRSGIRSLNGQAGIGSWKWVREAPHYMSSWLQSDEIEERDWEVSRFDLHGEDRNEGTLEATGRPTFVVASWKLKCGVNSATVRAVVHQDRIDWSADLDWREIGGPDAGTPGAFIHLGSADRVWAECPFGIVERHPANRDFPTLRLVATNEYTVLTSGKGGCNWDGVSLKMRLIRSSYNPDPLPEVNRQSFRWTTVYHAERPSDARLVQMGLEHNHPLLVCATSWHQGGLPVTQSNLSFNGQDLVVSCIEPGAATVTNYADEPRQGELAGKTFEVPARSTLVVDR